MDTMDDKVQKFFEAAKKAKPEQRQKEFEAIRKVRVWKTMKKTTTKENMTVMNNIVM